MKKYTRNKAVVIPKTERANTEMRRHYIPDDDPILMDRTINHFPEMPALKWKNKHQNEGHGSIKDEKHIFNRILVR